MVEQGRLWLTYIRISTFFLAEAVPKALLATKVLFGSALDAIRGQELIEAFEHDSRMVTLERATAAEMSVDRLALESGLCSSKCMNIFIDTCLLCYVCNKLMLTLFFYFL